MKKLLTLSFNDFRLIMREQILIVLLLLIPLLNFLVLKYGVPALALRFPIIIEYYALILGFVGIQTATVMGYVFGSVALDEKDEDMLTAIRVTPLPSYMYLAYRILFPFLLTLMMIFVILQFAAPIDLFWWQTFLIAFLFALPVPIIILLTALIATNKIEGLTVFKGINGILLLPIAAFFIQPGWGNLFGIIPTHWSYQFTNAIGTGKPFALYLLLALGLHLFFIFVLVLLFKRKIF